MLTAIVDWRGKGRWTQSDIEREADLFSVWQAWDHKPNPLRKTIVAFSAMLYSNETPVVRYAEPWGDYLPIIRGFNPVWEHGEGPHTVAIDMAALISDRQYRGLLKRFAEDVVAKYSWADGLHWDYWTTLEWLQPSFPYNWGVYMDGLHALATIIKSLRPDWIIVGQNFHFPSSGYGVGIIDGLFLEQSPTTFNMTMEKHTYTLNAHKALAEMLGRPAPTWVCEIGNPPAIIQKYGEAGRLYLNTVKQWCSDNDIYLSWGRDASAGIDLAL